MRSVGNESSSDENALKVRRNDMPSVVSDTAGRLLLSAARLFWQKGYAAASTREVAAQLGIQRASLYYHIKSKEDLLYDLSVASLADIEAQTRTALDGQHDPLGSLRALIRAHITSMSNGREMHATMLTELRSLSPEHRLDVIGRRDAYEALVRTILETCQQAGAVRQDISARLLGRCLLNLMNWSIFWFDPAGKVSTGELATVIQTIFLEGTLTPDHASGTREVYVRQTGLPADSLADREP